MSDSDDENVLYAPTGQDLKRQGKGLLGNGVKNVNDILNGPTDTRRVKKTLALCGAFIGLVGIGHTAKVVPVTVPIKLCFMVSA